MSTVHGTLLVTLLLALGLLYGAVALSMVTDVMDCGSSGKILGAEVEGCKESPCEVQRGSNVTVRILFEASAPVRVLRPEVVGLVSEYEIPIADLDHEDGCQRLLSGACPLEKGSAAEYTATFLLDPDFPQIKGEVRWHLFDEKNTTVVCIGIIAEAV